MQRKLRRRL